MSQQESQKQKAAREAEEAKAAEAKKAADEKAAEDAKKAEAEKAPAKKYFKSNISGLAFQVSESDPENPVAPEVVRFVPYFERYQGDRVKVGYLATNDPRVLDRVVADPNTEEITSSDFKSATGKDSERASY